MREVACYKVNNPCGSKCAQTLPGNTLPLEPLELFARLLSPKLCTHIEEPSGEHNAAPPATWPEILRKTVIQDIPSGRKPSERGDTEGRISKDNQRGIFHIQRAVTSQSWEPELG
ncbi:hypothetical protein KM043_002231 [Ampulex compressa]|nr:hypothetical protein KM043_002231 [Ampulex compressa]